MMLSHARPLPQIETVSDAELVRGALAREPEAFRAIMTRHNQRLYRLARSILRSDAEAEDALQDAYLHAFAGLHNFRGDSALSTWLSRIVVNEALGRLRKWRSARTEPLPAPDQPMAEIIPFPGNASADDPERTMAQRQIVAFVEAAADELPDAFRAVFFARAIEGLSVEETAELLVLKPETVKTRLHRARAMLRKRLDEQMGPLFFDAFPFAGRRCERLTGAVMYKLGF